MKTAAKNAFKIRVKYNHYNTMSFSGEKQRALFLMQALVSVLSYELSKSSNFKQRNFFFLHSNCGS